MTNETVEVGMTTSAENSGNQSMPMIAAPRNVQREQIVPPVDNQSIPAVGAATTFPVNHLEKPEKFNGVNFVTWQQKMLFYLTTLNLARYLTEEPPQSVEGEMDDHALSVINAWNKPEYVCRNYLLNGLADHLYTVYSGINSAKEL
ncbi:hypothetical protein LINGRAHAP2_LOCUS29646, partial [Linum grandiflorum]